MTMHDQTPENLVRLVQLIDDKLTVMDAGLGLQPSYVTGSYDERTEWNKNERLALQELLKELQREEGASFNLTGAHDHSVRLAAFRSSSTSGWRGCLHNWQTAARKRIAKEAI